MLYKDYNILYLRNLVHESEYSSILVSTLQGFLVLQFVKHGISWTHTPALQRSSCLLWSSYKWRYQVTGTSVPEWTNTQLCLVAIRLPWHPKDVGLNLVISVA